jgi:hypothetical protein
VRRQSNAAAHRDIWGQLLLSSEAIFALLKQYLAHGESNTLPPFTAAHRPTQPKWLRPKSKSRAVSCSVAATRAQTLLHCMGLNVALNGRCSSCLRACRESWDKQTRTLMRGAASCWTAFAVVDQHPRLSHRKVVLFALASQKITTDEVSSDIRDPGR